MALKKKSDLKINKNIYLSQILDQVPRILGLIDSNPASKTYGCFDRQHWNYSISDIPQARKQEAVLTLTLLYLINNKKNIYFNNKKILSLINASLEFWCNIQEKNGSFNDLYPKENSLVATAFSSYAVSETLLLLGDKIKDREKIIYHLKKSGDWLLNKKEIIVRNQESGTAVALYNIYLLTNAVKYKISSEQKINSLIKSQTEEGWFYEYGGPDIGYLSLTIDYLAKYYKKTNDKIVLNSLKKAIKFISYFVHEDGTFGGTYGSRNTEYLIPHGFEVLAKNCLEAKYISKNIRASLNTKKTIAPFSLDDKYLLFLSYTYLQAYLDSEGDYISRLTKEKIKLFKKSGFFILDDNFFNLVVNCNKGGSFKLIFKNNKKSLNDSGIVLQTKNSKLISGWLDKNNFSFDNSLVIKGKFRIAPNKTINPMKNIMLRLFQITIGRNEKISLAAKNKLRKALITGARKTEFNFFRVFRINKNSIEVVDEIDLPKNLKKVLLSTKSSFIYGESASYFQESDLDYLPIILTNTDLPNLIKLKIYRKYDEKGNLLNFKLN